MDFTIKLAEKKRPGFIDFFFIDKQWEKNHIFVKSKNCLIGSILTKILKK